MNPATFHHPQAPWRRNRWWRSLDLHSPRWAEGRSDNQGSQACEINIITCLPQQKESFQAVGEGGGSALMSCVFHLKPHSRWLGKYARSWCTFQKFNLLGSLPLSQCLQDWTYPTTTHSLSGSLRVVLDPCLTLSKPPGARAAASLSWCYSNISLRVDVSRLRGRDVLGQGDLCFPKDLRAGAGPPALDGGSQ